MNHHESSWIHMNTSDLIAEHSRDLSRVVLVRFWTKSGIVVGGDNQWGRMTVSPMECAHKDGIKMWYFGIFLTNMIVWTCSKFFLVKHQHGHFTNSNVDPGRHRTSYPSAIGCDWESWSSKWTTKWVNRFISTHFDPCSTWIGLVQTKIVYRSIKSISW